MRRWTELEELLARLMWREGCSVKEMTEKLGRTENAMKCHVKEFREHYPRRREWKRQRD